MWRARGLKALTAVLFLGVSPQRANPQEPPPANKDVQASLVAVPAEVPADAPRYAVLMAGNRAGVLAAWDTSDGAHHSTSSERRRTATVTPPRGGGRRAATITDG